MSSMSTWPANRLPKVIMGSSGTVSGPSRTHKRMDDMHRLLMILIGVAGGGLLTAVIGLVFQLLE